MSDTPSLQGQVALVTGATRGIGRAIALELASRGVKVVGTATTESGAASITQALQAAGGQGGQGGQGICLNVTDGPALEAAIDSIVKAHGGLHILVNNAGITRDMLAMRLKDEDWDAVIDT
ncbi:MAG: SDR family NAD(P)-dependent oxidoreductase, partial [Burkholderiaceae bacterium]